MKPEDLLGLINQLLELKTVVSAGLGALGATLLTELVRGRVRRAQTLEAQRDADVEYLIAKVEEVLVAATSYWASDARKDELSDVLLSSKVIAGQMAISQRVAALFSVEGITNREEMRSARDYAQKKLEIFMDTATSGLFLSRNRERDLGKIRTIHLAAEDLKFTLRELRRTMRRSHWA